MKFCLWILLIYGAAQCSLPFAKASYSSCIGRCGIYDSAADCQCNSACTNSSSCCSDYGTVCYSCDGRCGEYYLYSKPCQCNVYCPDYSNCCDDYDSACNGGGHGSATDADVIALSEELYTLSQPFLVGDLITYDAVPPGPFFTFVDPSALTGPTMPSFMALRDNYDSDATNEEVDTSQELTERQEFLDAIMATDVMNRTGEFLLTEHDMIAKPLRNVIEEIFFSCYPLDGSVLSSSGFERVFLGEIQNGKVSGFHNWISFYEEELTTDLVYKEFFGEEIIGSDVQVVTTGFNWKTYPKSMSSMFIGSPPELELALYTVCFFHKPGGLCDVSMNGMPFKIQTYTETYNENIYVGLAHPVID